MQASRYGIFVVALLLIAGVVLAAFTYGPQINKGGTVATSSISITSGISSDPPDPPSLAPSAISNTPLTSIPTQKILEDGYYVAQTFNNCAPSALSMDLSYYGVHVSQETLADDLRPTHNLIGKDDDKSTSPEEVAAEAEKYGLTAYYRPNGTIPLLEEFIANGIPVITRTQFIPTEDFGHYRVMKGYNQATGEIIDEDGFQGPEVDYKYADFLPLWQQYNYEYIVLVPPGKEALVQSILGKEYNANVAWQDAVATAQQQLAQDPTSVRAGFNLSVALYHTGDYQGSVAAFQKVQPELSEHTLWYQLEPIEAYLAVGNYNEVFTLSNAILDDNNPVYPELYVLMGQAYLKEGNEAQAKADFEQALVYNKNLVSAQQALAAL
jgi:hypothetical protein